MTTNDEVGKSLSERIFEMLRPAIVGPLRLMSLTRVSDAFEWCVWCECHQDWLIRIAISGYAAADEQRRRTAPQTAAQQAQIAWEFALKEAEQRHAEC